MTGENWIEYRCCIYTGWILRDIDIEGKQASYPAQG